MNIKKYGVLISTFLLTVLGFINGCFTQVSAATNTTVLPIAKGGTGSNSASGAATNILGSNYANYSGILPVAKGGTGAGINDTKTLFQAQKNLGLPPTYIYVNHDITKNQFYKFSEEYYGSSSKKEFNALIQIVGGTFVPDYARAYDFYLVGRNNGNNFFEIMGRSPNCSTTTSLGFYTKDENDIYKFYYSAPAWGSFTRITWEVYGYGGEPYNSLIFTPETIYNIPAGATTIYPTKCLST
jgi:hypothetical protein